MIEAASPDFYRGYSGKRGLFEGTKKELPKKPLKKVRSEYRLENHFNAVEKQINGSCHRNDSKGEKDIQRNGFLI